LVLIEKLTIDAETTLWLFMAEPDHDGSCSSTTEEGFAPFFL